MPALRAGGPEEAQPTLERFKRERQLISSILDVQERKDHRSP